MQIEVAENGYLVRITGGTLPTVLVFGEEDAPKLTEIIVESAREYKKNREEWAVYQEERAKAQAERLNQKTKPQ